MEERLKQGMNDLKDLIPKAQETSERLGYTKALLDVYDLLQDEPETQPLSDAGNGRIIVQGANKRNQFRATLRQQLNQLRKK